MYPDQEQIEQMYLDKIEHLAKERDNLMLANQKLEDDIQELEIELEIWDNSDRGELCDRIQGLDAVIDILEEKSDELWEDEDTENRRLLSDLREELGAAEKPSVKIRLFTFIAKLMVYFFTMALRIRIAVLNITVERYKKILSQWKSEEKSEEFYEVKDAEAEAAVALQEENNESIPVQANEQTAQVEALQKEIQQIQVFKKKLEDQIENAQIEKRQMLETMDKLKNEADSYKAKAQKTQTESENYQLQLEGKQKELRDTQSKLNTAQSMFYEIQEQLISLNENLENRKKQIAILEKNLHEKEAAYTELELQLKKYEDQIQTQKDKITQLNQQVSTAQNELSIKTSEAAELKTAIESKEKQISKLQEELKKKEASISTLTITLLAIVLLGIIVMIFGN